MHFCSLSFYLLRRVPGTSLLPFSAAELLFSLDHEHDPKKLIVILDLIYGATHSFIVAWSPGRIVISNDDAEYAFDIDVTPSVIYEIYRSKPSESLNLLVKELSDR